MSWGLMAKNKECAFVAENWSIHFVLLNVLVPFWNNLHAHALAGVFFRMMSEKIR